MAGFKGLGSVVGKLANQQASRRSAQQSTTPAWRREPQASAPAAEQPRLQTWREPAERAQAVFRPQLVQNDSAQSEEPRKQLSASEMLSERLVPRKNLITYSQMEREPEEEVKVSRVRTTAASEKRLASASDSEKLAWQFNALLQDAIARDNAEAGKGLTAEEQAEHEANQAAVFGTASGNKGRHTTKFLAELGITDDDSTIDDYLNGHELHLDAELREMNNGSPGKRAQELRQQLLAMENAITQSLDYIRGNGSAELESASPEFRSLLSSDPRSQIAFGGNDLESPEGMTAAIYDAAIANSFSEEDLNDTLEEAGISRSDYDAYAEWRANQASQARDLSNLKEILSLDYTADEKLDLVVEKKKIKEPAHKPWGL